MLTTTDTTKIELGLRKTSRVAKWALFLLLGAMVVFVMIALLAVQPLDQKSLAQNCAPLLMLLAAIAGLSDLARAVLKARSKG